MRIGIDARMLDEGLGIGRYIAKLLSHLEAIQSDDTFVVFLTKKNWNTYQPKTSRFVKVLAHVHWYTFAEQFVMPLHYLVQRLDLVHIPHINAPLLYPGRFVMTIHDLILVKHPLSATSAASTRHPLTHRIKYACYRFTLACAVRRASHIITVTEVVKNDIVTIFGRSKHDISVTSEGADPLPNATVCTELQRFTNTRFFFRAGNAYPHKNVEGLLVAFGRLHLEYPHILLLLCGQDDFFQKRIAALIKTMDLADVVFHLGSVSDACLAWLYAHAYAYVFPSFEEGFGLPAVEAFLQGCPVLAADIPVLREVCGSAALYFNPGSSDDIMAAMKNVLNDPAIRPSLIRAGNERSGQFSWDRLAKETMFVYTRFSQRHQ